MCGTKKTPLSGVDSQVVADVVAEALREGISVDAAYLAWRKRSAISKDK